MSNLVRFLLLVSILALFYSSGIVYAQDQNFLKPNSFAVKGGYHIYESSDFTNFWRLDKNDYNSFAGEMAYERVLAKYFSLELPFGYYYSKKTYNYKNIVTAGDQGTISLSLTNIYFSPSIKANIPVQKSFIIYFGLGPDLYYTNGKVDANYQSSTASGNFSASNDKVSLGIHGLVGAEYSPVETPWGIFLDYRYTYVNVTGFDKPVINDLNQTAGTSVGYHDFKAGGHLIFFGVRYHF